MEDIKKKIKQKEKEIEELKMKLKTTCIKKLEEYTDEEKILWFNETYNTAKEELEEYIKNKYEDEDNKQYAWERFMEILGKNIWTLWNNIEEKEE